MKMIEVKDVTMKFRMGSQPINSLKEYVTTTLKGSLKFNEFVAVNHLSFDLEKGQTLGLIGHNGAGKSTTLKLISGILKPTSGRIITRGNIVPMLELGAGFDLELTGRENIYLNGAVLGYTKKSEKQTRKVHFIEQVEGTFDSGKRPANKYRFNKDAYLEAKKNGIRIEFYC